MAYYLNLNLCFGYDILDHDFLNAFSQILVEHAPEWAKGAHFFLPPRERRPVDLKQPGTVFDALDTLQRQMEKTLLDKRHVRVNRRFGMEELRGASREVIVIINHDEQLIRPIGLNRQFGNTVTFQICRARVGGGKAQEWERRILGAIVARLQPWYSTCGMTEEHNAKSMEITETIVRAIGKDISRALPGLYWQNYFGPAYCREIGEERLLSTPRARTRRLGNGVVVELSEDPRDWQSEDYLANEAAAIRHIGEQWFFQRHRGYEGTRPLPLPE